MASITLTTPTSGSTVAHTFPAGGTYSTTTLLDEEGKLNYIQSVVTQNGTTLDTRQFPIPGSAPSGNWSVTHTVPGSETLTGCVVTATLYVNGVAGPSAFADDITINDPVVGPGGG